MINHNISGSEYINVSSGYIGGPNINSTVLSSGQVRYNGNVKSLEVYDGYVWHEIRMNAAYINVSPELEKIISWANKRMFEENEIQKLVEKYPALKDAKEKYEIILGLIKSDQKE